MVCSALSAGEVVSEWADKEKRVRRTAPGPGGGEEGHSLGINLVTFSASPHHPPWLNIPSPNRLREFGGFKITKHEHSLSLFSYKPAIACHHKRA